MVGIIILNYNNIIDIKLCVNSLLEKNDMAQLKLLIIENGSTSDNYEEVRSFLINKVGIISNIEEYELNQINELSKYSILRLTKNYGYAKGNNYGINMMIRDTSINHIMILNNDIIFTENLIEPLLHYVYEIPITKLGVVSPLLLDSNGNIDYCCARKAYSRNLLTFSFSYLFEPLYVYFREKYNILKSFPEYRKLKYIEVDLTSGSCMLFRKEVLQYIGGFDEHTFLYYEENILNKKMNKHGYVNYMIPSLSCIHVGGQTTNKLDNRYFLLKCNYDSLLYYMRYYEHSGFLRLLYIKFTGKFRLFRVKIMTKLRNYLKNTYVIFYCCTSL